MANATTAASISGATRFFRMGAAGLGSAKRSLVESQRRVAPGDLFQGEFAAFVVKLLESTEAVT
jgi:hypothetical protein